ncbi:aminotransferase class V-fold PLP-dependent enzyme [bacterium]|nr:aminotransferase class V-fold PLP-dependent enzyme [bacterium]MBT4633099.1 aminotransferase class V-fold PLP-dependent enzyme [bacterium]MBT5492421.1 aminotransferase class V-fold PLP-dependent enzyme [bacterium]MBT6778644.1 aminotransferase class V-fold PLP-dependent enzyme [bacterium]
MHSDDIADAMAEENICIRSGLHCAHPFLNKL